MTTWFTADLHFGHANIIEYCDRPFASASHMDAMLVARWNERVAPDDVVWVLGDVAMGRIDESLVRVGQLVGHKVLVTGNHDRCWHGHRNRERADEWVDHYLDAGFAEIVQGHTTIDVGGERVGVCHFPYVGDSHDSDRFIEHRPRDEGRWLLHGHVHERWAEQGRMINVGVDVRDYAPISEPEVARIIEEARARA